MAEKNLSIKLSLNDKQFQSALRKSTKSMQRFGNKMQNFGDMMTRNVTLPVIGLGAAAVKLASDFEETQSKFNTVFRDIREQANLTAKNLADDFGLSSRASMQLLSDTGDLLTGFGFTQQEALLLSNQVNELAVDLASFTNFAGGAEGASLALTKALLGERESIKQLGIAITEADLKRFAEDQGLVFKELDRVAKANLTYQLALQQSQNAVGDFARTSESFANQLRQLKGELEDVAIELGVELLPIAKSLVGGLRDLVQFTSQFTDEQKRGALQLAGYAAALGPIVSIGGRLVKAFAFLRKFFLGKFLPAMRLVASVLMNLTPQGRIVSGLILAASYLVTNWGKVKKGFDDLKDSILGVKKAKDELDTSLDFGIQGATPDPSQLQANLMNAIQSGVLGHKPKPVKPTPESRSPLTERIEPIKALKVELQSIPDVLDKIDVSFSETFTKMERMAMMVSSTIRNAFLSTADASEQSSKQMIASAKNAAREQIKIALATAVAEQMKSIFASVPFPFNLALAAGAGSIVGSLFSKVIPAFAEGGLVSGATLGMVGEGPGTSMSNPEVIAPLNKLKSMIGGGDGVQVFGTISGADILLSSDRAKNNRNRTRGY
jgi:hypothetical protein